MFSKRLRHRIDIERQNPITDAYGQTSIIFILNFRIWGEVLPFTGREFYGADSVINEVTAKIVTRYRTDITPNMRAKFGTMVYNIEAVVPVSQREIHLLCSSGVKDG
jgi:SPP1 family predicted phage head-tail adaptor